MPATRLVRIEVSGIRVVVLAESAGQLRQLGVFEDQDFAQLKHLFTVIGEPHQFEQIEGRTVMTWRLDANLARELEPREVADGSGGWPPGLQDEDADK